MNKKIIIVGPGASGKTYLINKFERRGFKKGIYHTTRPKRPNEIDGKDYYFIDNDTFNSMVSRDEFIEYKHYDIRDGIVYMYGLTKNEFNESDVFIMTPSAIHELSKDIRDNVFIMYLNPNHEIRYNRLRRRNDFDLANDRFVRDINVFKDFKDHDIMITNPNF